MRRKKRVLLCFKQKTTIQMLKSHAAHRRNPSHRGSPSQPCCAPRHPLGSPLAALLRIAAAPGQPCCAPRQPLGSMLLAPWHPLGSHALHLGSHALHLGNPSKPLGSHTVTSLRRLPQAHCPPYIYKCWHAHLARGSPMFHKN